MSLRPDTTFPTTINSLNHMRRDLEQKKWLEILYACLVTQEIRDIFCGASNSQLGTTENSLTIAIERLNDKSQGLGRLLSFR